jgi:hypothetical protein
LRRIASSKYSARRPRDRPIPSNASTVARSAAISGRPDRFCVARRSLPTISSGFSPVEYTAVRIQRAVVSAKASPPPNGRSRNARISLPRVAASGLRLL